MQLRATVKPSDIQEPSEVALSICILGCFKIAPLSNFLTAQQISDGVLAADYEFDSIF